MSGMISAGAQHIQASTAGVTGTAPNPPAENVAQPTIIDRIKVASDWGGLSGLFGEYVGSAFAPHISGTGHPGVNGGLVPNSLHPHPYLPTFAAEIPAKGLSAWASLRKAVGL